MSLPVSDAYNFSRPGAWGAVTSTLDFCEVSFQDQRWALILKTCKTLLNFTLSHTFRYKKANYQFSDYIAEMANTISNFFTIGIALYGARSIRNQALPSRYLFGFLVSSSVTLAIFSFAHTQTNMRLLVIGCSWYWKLCIPCDDVAYCATIGRTPNDLYNLVLYVHSLGYLKRIRDHRK